MSDFLAQTKKQSIDIHNQLNRDKHAVDFSVPKPHIHGNPYISEIEQNGFVIIEHALNAKEIENYKKESKMILGGKGRNNFEGEMTQRSYALLSKTRKFDELCIHPEIIKIVDYFLDANYLLSAFQLINILPGETRQPFHHDDQFIPITRPHIPFGIATIWAIDDFTKENGATLIFPKSHLWGEGHPPKNLNPIPCEMSAGSVVVFLSTLWHGGGPNSTSNCSRLGITTQYCQPYLRPQENQILSIHPSIVRILDPKLQSLIGYSIHPPFIGHVDGKHPLKTLDNSIFSKL